jgi:7-carboxy-7-deazaguanine synthase
MRALRHDRYRGEEHAVVPGDELTLPVNEVFHETIQGEGPAMGRTASFLRLMGCNLSCSWCDTPYTWDGSRFDLRAETTHRPVRELVGELFDHPGIVVVSGGEPLLHQQRPAFRTLLALLHELGKAVHIETNGTVAPNAHVLVHTACLVVSPKLAHAGAHRGHQSPAMAPGWRAVTRDPLGARHVHLKVVCRDVDDVDQAVALGDELGLPGERVWVMPEGTSAAELAGRWAAIAERAAYYGVSASHRLHVLAWGDERGR